jgi:hypothetical protein
MGESSQNQDGMRDGTQVNGIDVAKSVHTHGPIELGPPRTMVFVSPVVAQGDPRCVAGFLPPAAGCNKAWPADSAIL